MQIKRACVATLLILAVLAACQPAPAPTPDKTRITFTYWGSEMEKAAIKSMVAAFEAQNPDIDVNPVQLPYEDYLGRITAMINQGNPPDVG